MAVKVHEQPAEGGLLLVLYVEDVESARASVRDDVLADMEATLGLGRAEVGKSLTAALLQLHQGELAKVQIDSLTEAPPGSRRFAARFIFRDYRVVTEGLVWYDVVRSETGPSDASALVRNKLRFEVHAHLVGEDKTVDDLRKALG